MLVLTRKIGEKIQIGDDVYVMVVRLSNGSVRLGVEAPSHMSIVRKELIDKDHLLLNDSDSDELQGE